MTKTLQFLVFLVLQILFLPLAILGMIPAVYKEMVVSRKLGASFTAGQAIQPRWIMHYFGTREDEATVAFIKAFPIESHWGFLGVMGAAIVANRICGYTPGLAKVPEPGRETLMTFLPARVVHNDRLAKRSMERVEQVVLMGAGFDLRVLELSRGTDLEVFELDMDKTQQLKLATMKAAGIAYDHVTYVPIDFRHEDWMDKLIEAGFDSTKTTYFHWESVNSYLEEDVVRETLRKMAELCASGSVVVQDFYSTTLLTGAASSGFGSTGRIVAWMGEPWRFGIDMSKDAKATIEALLDEYGLVVKEVVLCGAKDESTPPFYAIVEAVKE
ncbi:MAG: SAM-dependent methyltransferase [Deltaproteobacteria bacterium]|nr:SAM-dependent methyltransferase [Deltaproteobacteria bacterium]